MSLLDSPFYQFTSDDHLLLLGATGLFGQHLMPRLHSYLKSDCTLRLISLVTRSSEQTLSKYPFLSSINLVENDFLQSSSINLDRPPTHVLHMANMSASDTYNGSSQYSKYLLLLNSVEALRKVVVPGLTKKIIFTSSGVAYGQSDSYCESDVSTIMISDPSYSLGFAKLNAEYLLSLLSLDVGASLTVCRCFSFVSPFLPCNLHYALGNFVDCAVKGKDIVIKGDGSDCRSYQHVEDAIDWLLYLLVANISVPVINIGSDLSISIKELAFLVRDLISPDISVRILNEPADPHNFRRTKYVPSLLTSKRLGLVNRRSLDSSILELSHAISQSTL